MHRVSNPFFLITLVSMDTEMLLFNIYIQTNPLQTCIQKFCRVRRGRGEGREEGRVRAKVIYIGNFIKNFFIILF